MLILLGFAAVLPGIGHAQATLVTENNFVSAQVSTNLGLITIWKGPPPQTGDDGLTFPGHSFLTVEVNNVYYTYNYLGGGAGSTPPSVELSNPDATQIKDTIRCVWKEQGFDIVQNVWPVQFANSGVIVISVKIVNHGSNDLPAQAEFLLNNENSTASGANDNPDLITNNGFITNTKFNPIWQNCPQDAPLPSFDLSFQNHPSAVNLETVGAGYFDNTYTPSPIGLLPLSLVQFGYWPDMEAVTWGPATPNASDFGDDATLMVGEPSDASSALSGDSVTEIFRTAYGTPDWCYDHGALVGVAMYPHHLVWDQATLSYSPNPFQVQTFLFTDDVGGADGVSLRQTVANPIHITSPKPVGPSNNDTTQLQNVGPIGAGGVAILNWTDSVVISPAPCTGTFPVNIDFSPTAETTDTSPTVFVDNPWGCPIEVDCAHPDITPPKFRNSFTECDSIEHDTVTVHDDTLYDTGLKDITYTSPNLTAAQYSVTIDPPPPYNCIDTSVKIFVQQVDTVHSGLVVFTFTDCAGNVSMDTVCFTAHPPVPDLTAPRFWIDSAVADCHAECQEWNVTDSVTSATSIDRGVDSLVIVSNTNMILSGVPAGGKFPPATAEATFHVCVMDSLLDGSIILRANDTSHNFSFDTITYCTTADTLPPVITPTDLTTFWHVHVTETRPWDRGIDSVWLEQTSNVTTVPVLPVHPAECPSAFDFDISPIDTALCASAMIYAKDCAGNVDSTPYTFTKGAIPVIAASKTTLCSTADSAVLDAGSGYTGYKWSNGDTTEKITVGAGMYSVVVQEGSGCPATSQPTTIILSQATPQITPPGPLAICTPGTETLDAGAGFATYQWLRDGSVMTDTTSETVTVGTTGNYTVQVTNAAGCSGTSQPVSVTINPLPSVPTISAANEVLTATSTTPNVTYRWSRNGTAVPGATSQTTIDSTGGSYTVTVTDANGCMSTSQPFSTSGTTTISVQSMVFAQQSQQVTIPLTVSNAQGVPAGALNFSVTIACNKTLLVPTPGSFSSMTVVGDSLIIVYTGSGSPSNGTLMKLPFTAALGDDSCTSVTIDAFSWSAPNITVTTQNGNFCLSNVCYQGGPQLINPNGTVSLSDPIPNPSNNSIEIAYSLIEQGQTTLILYDLLGHEVLRMVDASMAPGTYTVVADVSALPAGTYVYSLRTPTIVKSNHLQISR